MKGVSGKIMANLDVSKYILKRLEQANSSKTSADYFSSSTTKSNTSIFDDISFSNLENFDYTSAIDALTSGKADSANKAKNGDLSSIFQSLMSNDQVQELADTDGVDGVSEDEAKAFMQNLAGYDGDATSLTQNDIDEFIDSISVTTESDLEKLIKEAFQRVEDDLAEQKLLAQSAPKSTSSASSSSSAGSTSGSTSRSNSNYNSGTNSSSKTQTKTAADEVEELRKQRSETISDADKKIEQKQSKKDKLIADDNKISSELKAEYSSQQKALSDIQSKLSDTQSSLATHKASLADLEASIAALEGEKGQLKTDTKNSKVNKENKSRLSKIKESLTAKKEKKTKLSEKIKNEEAKITKLQAQEKEQQKNVKNVEKQISEQSPSLGKKIDSLNSSIKELKAQKTKDVAKIDEKIEAKEKAQKKEAKQAGVNKGKMANDVGSGLVDLASKYMGINEKDGSYKMFTNGRTESWCADFVTYVVKEYAKENGLKVASGFGSPAVSNLMSWAQKNGVFDNTSKMSNNQKLDYAKNNLSVGDVIIWKSNGASHTGIVKSIKSDGTFTTVEGNSSDQVKSNKKSIYDKSLTGFIKLSDIVS